MGYRDEGEAAMHRVASLEQQIVDERAQVASLQQSLAQANAEIVRLRGNQIPAPENRIGPLPVANRVVVGALTILSALSLLALAIASYGSERDGMAVAHLAVPVCGAAIAAWAQRRRAMQRLLLTSLGVGFFCFCALLAFFATIWRSL